MQIIDYIKSGEFTFCSRCGNICHSGDKNFMCRACVMALFPKKNRTELERSEIELYIRVEKDISDILIDYRKELAELRHNANSR